MPPPKVSKKISSIQGVRLAGSSSTWNIKLEYPSDSQGTIASVTPHESSGDDLPPSLALPALTHPHIHLDKAFIHNAREYSHLLPRTGTFQEALSFTTTAKESFTEADLLKRGEWLLAESVSSGVTAMRAFVEVDHTVQLICLDAAVTLKSQWSEACHIQIACFAQDPIFSSKYGEENRSLIEKALGNYPKIDVLGTTPYVESSVEASKKNIEWAVDRALLLDKHVDFHLDYNLDPGKEALIWHVLQTLQQRGWTSRTTRRRVMLGHCTRLTLLPDEEWNKVSRFIHENDLPVSFVGLPTSDLYMAAPPDQGGPHQRPRGTLRVPELIRKHNLDVVIGVNNVGNAFTPWGSADPLFLACVGVGVYQAGAQDDAKLLYECVSTRARAAIGLSAETSLVVQPGICPDLVLFHDRDDTGCGISRPRTSVAEVVWDPPMRTSRSVITNGRMQVRLSGFDDMKFEYA
ncbi:hypothetical protein N7451_011752 [Penicillium sp. IBT 35674x]|nr:hypothetical protein N7451_011752 [Penicillium sp. IBT 35674x]